MDRETARRDDKRKLLGPFQIRLAALLVLVALLAVGCGGGTPGGGEAESPDSGEQTSSEQALTPVEATVSPDENSSMMPAGGKEKDSSQAPPDNPPEGVQTYPASSNRTDVELPISYEQDPPTNGDHATYWQNCGFYSFPIENEAAVHSMDHGAVWITYQENLPEDQVDVLRDLAQQDYVLVSPYPGLNAPVVASAWRNQLEFTGSDDPRLQQFVDQFRRTETAPLSGNGCTDGRGEPEV